MKSFKSSHILILCLLAMGSFFIMATVPVWQPPLTDESMFGNGTHEDPLGVEIGPVYASVITQSGTAAPSKLELLNDIDATALTYTRDSTGWYKIEGPDDAFLDSTMIINISIGAATGFAGHAYRATDSTLLVRIFTHAGADADLVGKAYLTIYEPAGD